MPSLTDLWYRTWQHRLAAASLTSLRGKKVLCAFNAVVDRVVDYSPDKFSFLFRRFQSDSATVKRKSEREISFVDSPQILAAALLRAFTTGKAMHLPLSAALASQLEQGLSRHERLGGQAGIIANQLTLLGAQGILYCKPLSSHLTSFFSPRVKFPVVSRSSSGGNLNFVSVKEASRRGDETISNWIIEFKAGDLLKFGGQIYVAPRSNRLILSSHKAAAQQFDDNIVHLLPELGRLVDAAIISGYHSLEQRYSDGTTYDYYLSLEELYLRMLRAHKHIPIHVEFVSTPAAKNIDKSIYAHITKHVDSLGLNEVELVELTDKLGFPALARAIARNENVVTLHAAAEKVMKQLDLQRIHVHSFGYSLILVKKSTAVSHRYLRRQVISTLFGSLAATLRAMKGSEINRGEIASALSVPVSEIALQQMALMSHKLSLTKLRLENSLLSGIFDLADHYALIIPGQVAPLTPRTVGLGDVISSCSFVGGL